MGHRVEDALAELVRGKPIVVVDDDTGGDLVCAAEFVTPALVAFLVRYTSGYLCVALTECDADRLGLPPLVSGDPHGVSVDARHGTGTGISARDRAHTARLLADPSTVAGDLARPGHVVPLRARAGGVLECTGRAEAAVDLVRLAGLRPASLLGAIVGEHDPAEMARPAELAEFAARYDLCMITIEELVAFLRPRHIERVAEKRVRLCDKWFRSVRYRDADGLEHVALVLGKVDGEGALVRMHRECLDGDVFGSLDCECGIRLRESLAEIACHGRGILVYLREGAADGAVVTAGILAEQGVESVRLGGTDFDAALRAHGVAADECRPGDDVARQGVTGTVVHGDARGRELGFPTANLILDAGGAPFGDGVYGGLARVLEDCDENAENAENAWYVAAISVGTNPTFRGREQRFEVHLLDFDGDLYGHRLQVVPFALLRPTLAFESPTALVAQIEGDLRALRTMATGWDQHLLQLNRV